MPRCAMTSGAIWGIRLGFNMVEGLRTKHANLIIASERD